ncbi:26S proteasome regulatory subunit RPN2 [Astathelohania contejeani]|uniref:26S proteasome regulatory subunit RPN2 n=1 Tax=Astathelohania contejeani TaxID=164912 RepID=A0ABQ7HXD9_9MICR|nr:26S proteasome regulatory subunit RPN2 [Thelohania contejeani]
MIKCLHLLPNINQLLQSQTKEALDNALALIGSNLEILGLFLKPVIPGLQLAVEKYPGKHLHRIISQLSFIHQMYDIAVHHALLSEDLFVNDGSFYYRRLVLKILEGFMQQTNEKQKEYVKKIISNVYKDEAYIGYLIEAHEFEMVKLLLVNLLKEAQEDNAFTEMPNQDHVFIDLLIRLAREEDLLEPIYNIIIDLYHSLDIRGDIGASLIYAIIDALMYKNNKFEVIELIQRLKQTNIYLCFDACLYLSENNCGVTFNVTGDKAELINTILDRSFRKKVYLNFLVKNNTTDFNTLQTIVKPLSSRNTSNFIAICYANAIMNLGSTNDSFYRMNIDMFSHAKNWSKFISTACLGMIHTGNTDPYEILSNLFPGDNNMKNGGSLLALGLINAGECKEEDISFLLNFIENKTSPNELIHGACLGLGLVCIGIMGNDNNEDIISNLKEALLLKLNSCDTIEAEGAAYALGMMHLGYPTTNIMDDLLGVAKSTSHVRLARCIGVSLALALGNTRHVHLGFINSMLLDKDEVIRYGGIYCLGSAYAGTGNINILGRLLSSLGDGSPDNRRAAVLSIGLVCCNDVDMLYQVLYPLAQNHCPLVRGAVALCLGFFMAGTGDIQSLDLIEVLLYDSSSLVKQSACIGAGFILMQCNPLLVPNYVRVVERLNKLIIERSEDASYKFGTLLGRSIVEASGRNIIFSVKNMFGKVTSDRICGYILFTQYWYWYPMFSFLSMLTLPTAYFCFDESLEENFEKQIYDEGSRKQWAYHPVKMPETKKSRRFRKRSKETAVPQEKVKKEGNDDEVGYTIGSSERITLLQGRKLGLKNYAIKFDKKEFDTNLSINDSNK